MNDPDLEAFEADLRRLQPAPLPAELRARLDALPSRARPQAAGPACPSSARGWAWWRWWVPATAGALALGLVAAWLHHRGGQVLSLAHRPEAALQADEVLIDRTLLDAFDTVVTLPDGEPVRLQCRQWLEAVTLRDSARGIEVEQRAPRVEILPVRLETY